MREQKVEEPSRTSSLPRKGSHLNIRLHSCIHSLVFRYLALLRPDQGFCDLELGVSICLLQGLGGWAQLWMLVVWSPLTQPCYPCLSLGVCALVSIPPQCDELGRTFLVCSIDLLWLACVGPRALHSLGVAFPFNPCGVFFTLLQFGSVSLRSDLGFEFRPLQTWISIFWLGFQFSLGELCWFDLSISRSLSLYRLGELSWIYCCCSVYCQTLQSDTDHTQLGPCWTKCPLVFTGSVYV